MRLRRTIILLLFCPFLWHCSTGKKPDSHAVMEDSRPNIDPDYADIVVPPNIAPMNFAIENSGDAYYIELFSENGNKITISSRSPKIQIPPKQWKRLLETNRGNSLHISICVREKDGAWHTYQSITNTIANENIEPYLAYRLIKPLYVYWDQMGIYQRDLTSFREHPIFLNRATGDNCINCHSFHDHNPDRFLFHMRAGEVGTAMMLVYDGKTYKIDTSTPFNRATAYRAWHPNGRLVAFSVNTVKQFFHTVGENRDVYDKASDLVLYDLKTNSITTAPQIASLERMETYPEWSPDGTVLYFCVADGLDAYDESEEHPYTQIKYDLMRVSYDINKNNWGDVEPVLPARELGLSVTHPKVSPDGRFVLFCMSGYGNFTIYKQDADLYLLNTETKEFHALDVLNSDKSESYHSWSRDGHWIVFSSKHRDGLCARPYFSHVDQNGTFSKPFILPQKDPAFYRTFLKTYNIPEFISGPVTMRPQKIAKKAWENDVIKAKLDPNVGERHEEPEEEMWKQAKK